MNERVLKSGNGLLYGISNNKDQPGKRLTCYDGEIVLCIFKLDKAFPATVGEIEGILMRVPGMIPDVVFTRELRVQTDGEALEIDWR